MDKCREEFDLWIIENNKSTSIPNFIMKDENGEYVDRQTAYLWIGWQASRERMKAIKLPDIKTESLNSKETEMVEHVSLSYKLAITSAGYKVEQ